MSKTAALAKPVNLRMRDDVRALIDRAASHQGKSRSEFMVDAARRAAEEALLDQTLFKVGDDDYRRFLDILDMPPEESKLARLMRAPRPWAR